MSFNALPNGSCVSILSFMILGDQLVSRDGVRILLKSKICFSVSVCFVKTDDNSCFLMSA